MPLLNSCNYWDNPDPQGINMYQFYTMDSSYIELIVQRLNSAVQLENPHPEDKTYNIFTLDDV